MIISQAPSPNFGPRAAGKKVKYLILHYTDTQSAFDSLKILQDPAREASAHYLVDEDGSVLQLVAEEMRAWHAGKSWWEGETDINSCSIGIEIQNPGHGFGYRPFPDVQTRSVIDLCRGIIDRHGINPAHVLAHSDVAPARKVDPGELFPWADLARQHVGIWPDVTDHDKLEAEEIFSDPDKVKSYLTYIGYDSRLDLDVLASAFQRHFVQDIFLSPPNVGVVDRHTLATICAVRRTKLALRVRV